MSRWRSLKRIQGFWNDRRLILTRHTFHVFVPVQMRESPLCPAFSCNGPSPALLDAFRRSTLNHILTALHAVEIHKEGKWRLKRLTEVVKGFLLLRACQRCSPGGSFFSKRLGMVDRRNLAFLNATRYSFYLHSVDSKYPRHKALITLIASHKGQG